MDKLLELDLHLLDFDPLRATSYIPIPAYIQNEGEVINIRNNDEKCFYGLLLLVYISNIQSYIIWKDHHYLECGKEFNLQGI